MLQMSDSEVDDTVCPVCEGSTYVGETISCEICTRWFHFNCVGVTHEDDCVQSETVPYYCPSCDVSVRRAKKAKKQAQAKIMKAKTSSASKEIKIAQSEPARTETESSSVSEGGSPVALVTGPDTDKKKSNKRQQEDEEEAWLEAVESGDLTQVESLDSELRSLREPRFRTARQRAADQDLEMLEFGKRPEKEVTEEERMIKAQKRKELETEKREKMKQKTMDTLLKKKDSKATKQIKIAKSIIKEDTPKISYVSNSSGMSLSYPAGHQFPLVQANPVRPPIPSSCQMCPNIKKYNSSKTGHPLCSLECYKSDIIQSQKELIS